ncbi:MAG: transporter substrate-binding domain-containing protein [Eubacteriaceae bacterium]
MKRMSKIGLLLLAVTMMFSLVACSSSSTTTSGAKKYAIATDTTFAPFEFEDSAGKMVGIDMDLLAAIAADQNFEYEVKVLGFNAALQAVEAKQVDGMIAGMSITEDRKAKFDFSEPYFDSGVAMAVLATNNEIKSYNDLAGKKVAVKTGTEGATFAESIKDQYGFTIVTFEDSANMYEDVKAGNSVALFEDYPVIGYAISQGQPFAMPTPMEKGSSYGFAVSKGNDPELIQMFNKGLENIKASGKYQEILDTYIKK